MKKWNENETGKRGETEKKKKRKEGNGEEKKAGKFPKIMQTAANSSGSVRFDCKVRLDVFAGVTLAPCSKTQHQNSFEFSRLRLKIVVVVGKPSRQNVLPLSVR